VLREQRIEQMAHQESSRASELRTRLAALSATSPSHPTTRKTAAVMIEDKVTAAAQTTEQNDMLAEVQQKIDSLHKALKEQQALLTLREAQLNAAREDRNSLSERLTETKSDLDQSRNDLKRLEQNLVDRDRSVDDQGERIETLQSELSERLEALRNLQVKESASDVIDIKQARADAASSAADGADTRNATLLCLTSDMPEQHVITKPVTIIGRSAESDIQIVTHFVSREHARICKDRNGIVIENLGSTNGVFVNSIRVERQTLRHGDWVTIGETQFRFLEDGAE